LCDTSEDIHAEIDESNIREEYSDLTLIKGDRVLAGAYIGYDLSLNEVVYRMPVSQVAGVDIEASNLR
jgi:hypothetical protein